MLQPGRPTTSLRQTLDRPAPMIRSNQPDCVETPFTLRNAQHERVGYTEIQGLAIRLSPVEGPIEFSHSRRLAGQGGCGKDGSLAQTQQARNYGHVQEADQYGKHYSSVLDSYSSVSKSSSP